MGAVDGRAGTRVLWPRAVIVGLLTTALGGVGHASAAGRMPGATTMGFLLLSMVVLSAPLLVRQASGLRLASMLGAGQALVHLVLTATAGHATGHAAHATTSAGDGLVATLGAHVAGHAPMMAAHAGAAALVGLWLARGERALWTVIRVWVRRLRLDLSPRAHHTTAPSALGSLARHYPRVRVALRQSLPSARRGPPLAV
jgi:hypothetical protein